MDNINGHLIGVCLLHLYWHDFSSSSNSIRYGLLSFFLLIVIFREFFSHSTIIVQCKETNKNFKTEWKWFNENVNRPAAWNRKKRWQCRDNNHHQPKQLQLSINVWGKSNNKTKTIDMDGTIVWQKITLKYKQNKTKQNNVSDTINREDQMPAGAKNTHKKQTQTKFILTHIFSSMLVNTQLLGSFVRKRMGLNEWTSELRNVVSHKYTDSDLNESERVRKKTGSLSLRLFI